MKRYEIDLSIMAKAEELPDEEAITQIVEEALLCVLDDAMASVLFVKEV